MSQDMNFITAIRFLSTYMKNFKKQFIMFYFGWLLDSILMIVMPILFGIMIDEIVYYQNTETFINISLLYFVCILFSGGLFFIVYAQHGYLMNMFVFSIRRDIFMHLQKCNANYMSNSSTGEILAILQKYPEECMHFIIRNVIHAVNGVLLILLYTIYLLLVDWRIGTLVFVTGIFSVVVNTRFKRTIRQLGAEQRQQYEMNISWLYEVFTALRDIRILGAREKVEETFKKNQDKIFKIEIKSATTMLTTENIISFVNLIVRLTIYAIAALEAIKGNMSLGTLTVVFNFYEKLVENINMASTRYLDSQNRISYIEKIYHFLQIPVEKSGINNLDIKKGEICFRNIFFEHKKGDLLINNITLKIAQGEHVAIVGESGCGKTTLAFLLIGFYQPHSGEILIDGQNISECKLESLRKEIGLIQQDVLVFDGSIRQNLLMGNSHATETDIEEACKVAGLKEYISSLKDGLDTVIGSQGIGLSGGQKQRIAIARIYLRNPGIVIFDEATSSLDRDTEEAIHEVWRETLIGKTAIVIAHRQSSVMMCERVVILEKGKIVESGAPYDMIKSSNRFQKLFAIKKEV